MLRRRDFAAALAAAAGLAAAALVAPQIVRAGGPRVLRIKARKFEFTPREIVLKRGEPVVLELESLDRRHGFELPSFGLKGEFVPGEITHIAFTPDRAGRFGFNCNIFCGDGHDDMEGDLVVTE